MLSKTAQYAIRAVVYLSAGAPANHGAGEIAERIGAPPNYMGKMLKLLADNGVVVSSRGAGGGFRLARPAEAIRLIDIVEPIDKVSRWTTCFLGLGGCDPDNPCPIHPLWAPIREKYLNLLETKTVADIPPYSSRFREVVGGSPEVPVAELGSLSHPAANDRRSQEPSGRMDHGA